MIANDIVFIVIRILEVQYAFYEYGLGHVGEIGGGAWRVEERGGT